MASKMPTFLHTIFSEPLSASALVLVIMALARQSTAEDCYLDCSTLYLRQNPGNGECAKQAQDCGPCLDGYVPEMCVDNTYNHCLFAVDDDHYSDEDEEETSQHASTDADAVPKDTSSGPKTSWLPIAVGIIACLLFLTVVFFVWFMKHRQRQMLHNARRLGIFLSFCPSEENGEAGESHSDEPGSKQNRVQRAIQLPAADNTAARSWFGCSSCWMPSVADVESNARHSYGGVNIRLLIPEGQAAIRDAPKKSISTTEASHANHVIDLRAMRSQQSIMPPRQIEEERLEFHTDEEDSVEER